MKANFEKVLLQVLRHEGGWSDHPRDPGGATMKGVTLAVYRRFYGEERTKDDLRSISEQELEAIYRMDYWDKCWCDELPEGIDLALFDTAVNSGPSRAIRFIQQAVETDVDGAIGPNTLTSILSAESVDLVNKLLDARLTFLQSLGTWDVFGKGWTRRVEDLRHSCLYLCGAAVDSDSATAAESYQILRRGSEGKWVSKLQRALGIDVDGVFAWVTEEALVDFQKGNGLEADGVAGRRTFSALGLIGPIA